MPSIQQIALPVALESLRQPIRSFSPERPSDQDFKTSMLDLSDLLEELWRDDDDESLESSVVWTALYSFSALTVSGPKPEKLVDLAVGGDLVDAETADTLRTLKQIRGILTAFEPPGFAAALWRAVLLAIYGMIELFVVLDDEHSTVRCLELLTAAEAMADKFSGKA